MNCPEAVEWMHRYIDHDLNDEETPLLLEHISSCSDCAYKFELLNELSLKLSELPDVTPRYSLVDQIIPQLDEIDRARLEGGSAAEQDSLIEMIAPSAAANSRSIRSRREKQATKRHRNIRTGVLGTVAAAVILGIFITQYEPRTVPNADISMSNNSADTDVESTESGLIMRSFNGEAENSSQVGDEADANAGSKLRDAEAGEGTTGKDKSSSAADNNINREKAAAGQDVNKEGSSSDAREAAPAEDTADSGPAGSMNDTETDRQVNEPTQNSPVQDEPRRSDSTNDGEARGNNMEMMQPESQSLAPAQQYGITNMTAYEEWNSPDGMHLAILQGDHLYIYKVNGGEQQLIADQQVKGAWVKGEWSSDSTKFTYEAEDAGSITKHSLEAKSSTDAENSSQNQ